MKTPRIVNAVGLIDDDLIAEAEESTRKTARVSWLRWGAVAACFALLIAAVAVAPPLLKNPQTPPISDGGVTEPQTKPTEDRYKQFHIQMNNLAIVWRWEYQTIVEQYTSIDVEGAEFTSRGREVSASLIGAKRGMYEASGWDEFADREYHEQFEVYEITGVSPELLIAVKMEGQYYVFIHNMLKKQPPETLGEVLSEYGLAANVMLNRLSFTDDDGYYALENDDYIWSVLSDCADAPAADAEGWHGTERQYAGFTVTSEVLGVYKHALYVTEDGYVWTNTYDIEMLYFIGEDAAKKITNYVRENAVPTAAEPFRNAFVGKITAITETQILVDDSILCKDPADGIVYAIPLDDLRISRYVDCGVLRVGQTVQVEYEGTIDEKDHTVSGALAIHEARLTEDGTVLIPN